MKSNLVRAICILVLFQIVAVATAQAQTRANQAQCGNSGDGLRRQDVSRFQGNDGGPIAVVRCDGATYVGVISEMNSDSFTIKTGKNQSVQINYWSVKQIGLQRYILGPSRSEMVERTVEHYLLLPFTIIECLITSCGS